MKNLYYSAFYAIVLSFGMGSTEVAAAVYDLNLDWSDSLNPNSPWAYREGLNNLPSTADWTPLGSSVVQPAWSNIDVGPNFLPAWFKSTSNNPGGLDILAGDIVVHTTDTFRGPTGTANLIWTSPIAGSINVTGNAWMARDIGRGATLQILLNGSILTTGNVSSGDLFDRGNPFDLANGSGGINALQNISVMIGDEVQFALIANNVSTGGDFVGLNYQISSVPLPGALVFLVSGLVTLFGVTRVRKTSGA